MRRRHREDRREGVTEGRACLSKGLAAGMAGVKVVLTRALLWKALNIKQKHLEVSLEFLFWRMGTQ